MDAKRTNSAKYKLKTFMDAFGISYNSNPATDWAGSEGWAILGVEETDAWGEQNFVRKFVKG
jgi:hypothetical protein